MKDIDYFYEKDLDKTNILDFYNSLPSHLQRLFRKANNVKINWMNVLQGYRGPSNLCNNGSGDSGVLESSYGVQQIKYWWGARKDQNSWLPVVGSIAFLTARTVQVLQKQLDWSSLYFDSNTGQCLSHDQNKAAEKLNIIGLELFQEGKYTEAFEYCNNAYRFCTSGYMNEPKFKDNKHKAKIELDAMTLNSQGDNLFKQGSYNNAKSKYREAYNKSQIGKECTKYSANIDRAQTEIDAINLNSEGDNLFRQGQYSEAFDKYQEAYNKSQIVKQKNIYDTNKDKTQSIINKLWNEAWDAEYDTETDLSKHATAICKDDLNKSLASLEIYCNKFNKYIAVFSLKMEEDGIKSQTKGNRLLQKAIELIKSGKYELANINCYEAIRHFSDAQEIFKKEIRDNKPLLIFIVQKQINEVIRLIQIINPKNKAIDLQKAMDLNHKYLESSFELKKAHSNKYNEYVNAQKNTAYTMAGDVGNKLLKDNNLTSANIGLGIQ